MKTRPSIRTPKAFTLVELMVAIAIIGILAALLLPAVNASQRRAKRVWCISNLNQIGIAAHTFANDHNGRFPTAVLTNDGGALEFVSAAYQIHDDWCYFAFQLFRPLAGELGTPQLFACPADLPRWAATNFGQFDNRNVSYDISLQADPNIPAGILAADRNLPVGNYPDHRSIVHVPEPKNGGWGFGLHERKGNILFSDGHVEESHNAIILSEETISEDLLRPDVPPFATSPPPGDVGGPGTAGSASPPGGSNGSASPPPNFNPAQSGPISGDRMPFLAGFSGGNSNGVGSNPNPQMAAQPRVPPGNAIGDRHDLNRPYTAPVETQNPPATAGNAPAASGEGSIAATNPDQFMSPFDRQLARFLQRLIIGSYLLLWLLLVLFIAYKLWQRAQEAKQRRDLARLKRLAQESVLDSNESFR